MCLFISFSVLLILASQRIEGVLTEWLQTDWLKYYFADDVTTKRGSMPSLVEWAILAWVAGKKNIRFITYDNESSFVYKTLFLYLFSL